MPSRGYEEHNDEGRPSTGRQTSNNSLPLIDPIAERRKIHETYAAQYRQDSQNGTPPMGYVPLSEQPGQRCASAKPGLLIWGTSVQPLESNRATAQAHRAGSQRFSSRPPSASCGVNSLETSSLTQRASHTASHQPTVENNPIAPAVRGSKLTNSGLIPQSSYAELNQERFPDLGSPWAMRQPGITAAGPSASGNVPTRLPSSRLIGSQQSAASTPSAVATIGRNGLMVSNNENIISNGQPGSWGSNDSTRTPPNSDQSTAASNLFESPFSEYYQQPTSIEMVASQNAGTSNSAQRYFEDPDVDSLSLQLAQFTPAPTPIIQSTFGEGIFTRTNSELNKPAAGNISLNRKLTRTPSTFIPNNAITVIPQPSAVPDRVQSHMLSTKPDMNSHSRQSKLFVPPAFGTSEGNIRPQSSIQQARSVPFSDHGNSGEAFSPTSNLDDPFLDHYFNPRGNTRDATIIPEIFEDPWGPYDLRRLHNHRLSNRPTATDRAERNDRWNDTLDNSNGHTQHRRATSPYPSGLGGIDHYHGSPQQPSRTRLLASSRSQNLHAPNSGHSSIGSQQTHRPLYPSNTQRCGSSCYAIRLELDNTKNQLLECLKQRDQFHKLLYEFEHRLKLSESQNQRLLERLQCQGSPPTSKRSTDSPGIVDTATRLQQFYQQYLQHIDSEYHRGSPDTSATKDDQYFKSEFEMYFRSLKCWADRYLKFPNSERFSRELEESLKEVCERDDYVDSLIGHEKTKAFVVQGLISRFIVDAVLNTNFLKSFRSLDDENEMSKRCDSICKGIHSHISVLISRVHDPNIVDASYRGLLGIIQHAARLSVAMARAGGDKTWLIDFPRCHEHFKADWMDDAEQYFKNIDATVLEREGAVVKIVAMPLVVRVQHRKQPTVIYKAQVLLRPFLPH